MSSKKKPDLGSLIRKKAQKEKQEGRGRPESKPKRVLKGFYLQPDYAARFEMLKARLKIEQKKTGPELIEEALDLLFHKYPEG